MSIALCNSILSNSTHILPRETKTCKYHMLWTNNIKDSSMQGLVVKQCQSRLLSVKAECGARITQGDTYFANFLQPHEKIKLRSGNCNKSVSPKNQNRYETGLLLYFQRT